MSQELKVLASKIREGAKQVGLIRGHWMDRSGGKLKCCTLSGAAVACNPELKEKNVWAGDEVFSILSTCVGIDLDDEIMNPERHDYQSIKEVVVDLTDNYSWSRTRIAAYLEHYED